MIGCSQNDAEWSGSTDEQKISADEQRMVNIIRKGKYVTVENDQYVMNLFEKDAVRLGISKEFYVRAVHDLETLNAIIREGLEREKIDSTYSIVFPGRQTSQEKVINHPIRLKSGNEDDNETWHSLGSKPFNYNVSTFPGFWTFGVSSNMKKVKFELTISDITASVTLRINKKGNSLGTVPPSQADYQNVTLAFGFLYGENDCIREINDCIREINISRTATWDIDVTPQSGSGTVNASYILK
jgi:hypothetical protein